MLTTLGDSLVLYPQSMRPPKAVKLCELVWVERGLRGPLKDLRLSKSQRLHIHYW